ncbi:MAG: hypothetical protein WCA49_06445 [Candidatus Sulfotelmatobacter sp.]
MTTLLTTTEKEAVSIGIGGMPIALRTHDSSFLRLIEERDCLSVVIAIGGVAVRVNTTDRDFLEMLRSRYAGFVSAESRAEFDFEVDLAPPAFADPDADVSVTHRSGRWFLERGDFRAEWEPAARRGTIHQTANPYSIDAVLRIVHTLVLAKQGGFLLHSSSAIRNGKAFLFSGVSGAGKTTISRLAPPDATLLTDEISYVRREGNRYMAYGTPFAGELARPGENQSAPLSALFLLEKGPQNSIEPIGATEAIQRLLRNILFFAHDPELVKLVFQSACEFASLVPIHRLVFVPDQRVWDIIG